MNDVSIGKGRIRSGGLAVLTFLASLADASAWALDEGPTLSVQAGATRRQDTPVRLIVPPERLPGVTLDGPRSVLLRERPGGKPLVGQLDRGTDGQVRLTFILSGVTEANTARRFDMDVDSLGSEPGPWALTQEKASIDLSHRDRRVFRYNRVPVSNPGYPEIQNRDAYIHPAFTPSGALITGDYSKFHPHHRGFFLAYTKTRWGDLNPDFWNIHNGTGKVRFEGLDSATVGPVTARLVTRHRWESKGSEGPTLRERWEVEAYDIPRTPYWMFDLTTTQQAVGKPLELAPYRYGGMAYRGPEPFVKGALAVLTSEGHADRKSADQKPARWIDLTGPIAEGSETYGGAVMLDHPSNLNHPTVVRIHPTSLPFFCFVPSHDVKVTIPSDQPIVFRYRVVIHDGKPERTLDEGLWHDFADPPRAFFGDTAPR